MLRAEIIDERQYSDKQEHGSRRIDSKPGGAPAKPGSDFASFQYNRRHDKQTAEDHGDGLIHAPDRTNRIGDNGCGNDCEPEKIGFFQLFFHVHPLHRNESIER